MKTYTVELTELEAKVLKSLIGALNYTNPNSLGKALSKIYDRIHIKHLPYLGGKSDSEAAKLANKLGLFPHGQNTETSIPLSPQYTAVPKPEGVQVGCTLIPWEKVEEVMKHKPSLTACVLAEWEELSNDEARAAFARGDEVQWFCPSEGEWVNAGDECGFYPEFDYQVRRKTP